MTARLFGRLSALRHNNGTPICIIYNHGSSDYTNSKTQGPIVAFKIKDTKGKWLKLSQLDDAANEANIHLRTGDVCNPGGIALALGLAPWELVRNYAAGVRCGCKNVVIGGKPSDVARVSVGAMTTARDVDAFVNFIETRFRNLDLSRNLIHMSGSQFFVDTILVYPIHGCGGWRVPSGMAWRMGSTGLQWDRAWCFIDLDDNVVLSQEAVPQLALGRPEICIAEGVLKVRTHTSLSYAPEGEKEVSLPLQGTCGLDAREVCYHNGVKMLAHAYIIPSVLMYFSQALRRRCTIAKLEDLDIGRLDRHGQIDDAIITPATGEDSFQIINTHWGFATRDTTQDMMSSAQIVQSTEVGEPGAKSFLRPRHEVLAESMGANLVLATPGEFRTSKKADNAIFVNLGRRYTGTDGSPCSSLAHKNDYREMSSKPRDISHVYHIARVSQDTLPKENLSLEIPKNIEGLRKVRWRLGESLELNGKFEVRIGQRWDFV